MLKLDVNADNADDIVLFIRNSAGHGDNELACEVRLVHIHNMQVAALHGHLEPLAVREVVANGQGFVGFFVHGVGDGRTLEAALGVREVAVLDKGILAYEFVQSAAGFFAKIQQVLIVHEPHNKVGGKFASQLFHVVEFGSKEFGHELLYKGFHFFVREVRGAPGLFVDGHDGVVDIAHCRVLFGNLPVFFKIEIGVDPVCHARAARLVGDDNGHRAAK